MDFFAAAFLYFVRAFQEAHKTQEMTVKIAVLAREKVDNGIDIGVDNGWVSDCPVECPLQREENDPFWACDFLQLLPSSPSI